MARPSFSLEIIAVLRRSRHLWQDGGMAKKRKVKKFTRVAAVKALARERVGTPPAEQIVAHRKEKKEKHKPTLEKLLSED